MAKLGVATSATQQSHQLIDALPSGTTLDQMESFNHRRRESNG
jgi:hypothetical protein